MADFAKTVRSAPWGPYAAALAYVAVSTTLRLSLGDFLGTRGPWLFFFPAIVLAAWQFGFGPGLFSLFLSAVAGIYLFIPPTHTFHLLVPGDAAVVAAFIISGATIVLFGSKSNHDRLELVKEARRREAVQRELAEALQGQKEELERRVLERTAELEGFTYSVSHDMRAPLRAIAGNASILLEDYAEAVPPDAADLLVRMRAAANKMGSLIEDLLTYARLGNQAPKAVATDLSAIFREVAEEEKGDADVAFVAPDRLPAACDPGLVRMVLQNLVGNALKYRRKEGMAHIELGKDADGSFFVRDDGIGFEMQYAPKLFLPFERLHRDTEYPGTGIGLANVKRIVERHGGEVRAYGEPGKGATFWFSLPDLEG